MRLSKRVLLVVAACAVHAAPPALAASVTSAALADSSAAVGGLSAGVVKTAAWAGGLLLVGGGLVWLTIQLWSLGSRAMASAGESSSPLTQAPSVGVGTPANLAASYNAKLGDAVSMDIKEHLNNLGEFPIGERVFAGVKFSVQGVIHLGSIYPSRVEGIKVGARCQRLHLLHGTAGWTTEGAACAVLTLHYADGSTAELEIRYGEHVRDWWNWNANEPATLDTETEVAWWGENDYSRQRKCRLRVHRSTFANPKPDQVLETIDFAKRTPRCNPFLLGLSIE